MFDGLFTQKLFTKAWVPFQTIDILLRSKSAILIGHLRTSDQKVNNCFPKKSSHFKVVEVKMCEQSFDFILLRYRKNQIGLIFSEVRQKLWVYLKFSKLFENKEIFKRTHFTKHTKN